MKDSNVEKVCKLFQERSFVGTGKYGVTTDRADLSVYQWLVHLQEELMDATIYIEKLKKEILNVQVDTSYGAIAEASAHEVQHLRSGPSSTTELPTLSHWGLGAESTPAYEPSGIIRPDN